MESKRKIQQYPIADKTDAIKNMGGMVWLYDKHLSRFKLVYSDSTEQVRAYLQNGDSGKARSLVHSIKGLAGTLGLRQLYLAASELEQAIINSDPAILKLLACYDYCLTSALSENE